MRSARAGVLISALVFFTSAGAAHAHPYFTVTEEQARAGDVVHFAIAAAKTRVDYELEIDDRDVLQGSGAGSVITGEFTMPDLGERAKTVKVEAEMRESGKGKKKVKQKVEYLGPASASPAPDPPASDPAPAAGPSPQAGAPSAVTPNAVLAAPQQPPPAPKAAATPAAPAPAVKRETRRSRSRAPSTRERPARRAGAQRKRTVHRRERTTSRRPAAARRHRAGRLAPRTAPLFDGVPEPGSRKPVASASAGPTTSSLNALVPPAASLGAEATERDRLRLALLVPALAAMAALALAGTALQRHRSLRRG